MWAIITVIFAFIGITAAVASGLYVVLAQWIGLNIPYWGCVVITLVIVVSFIYEGINAKEGE